MTAKHFGYYDNWKTELLTCPKCGWIGTFEQGAVESYEQSMASSCPSKDCPELPLLATVTYPTTEETDRNLHLLSESDRKSHNERKAFLAEFESSKLKSPDELPDLPGSSIVLIWDQQESRTVLLHEGKTIWSEVAVYEGADRFVEIVRILKQKYGTKLTDLVPTNASGIYLYGDATRTISTVERARASLRD